MPSLGKGISDAVRAHISIWVDTALTDALYQEYQKSGGNTVKTTFNTYVKTPETWVRKSRKNNTNGYERLYQCKQIPKATLIVYSPPTDDCANAYLFCVDNKPIAGGKTKLKSTHLTNAISTKDKTSLRPQDVVFVKLTEEEIRAFNTKLIFGDGFDRLEERLE